MREGKFFTTFAADALTAWTETLFGKRSRGSRAYFGSAFFWLILVPLVLVLKIVAFGAGIAAILVAQLVVWLLDLLTWGHFGPVVAKLAVSSASFDEAREQSVKRWSK